MQSGIAGGDVRTAQAARQSQAWHGRIVRTNVVRLQDLPRIVRITRRIRHQLHEKCYFRLIDEHNVRGPPRYYATVGPPLQLVTARRSQLSPPLSHRCNTHSPVASLVCRSG